MSNNEARARKIVADWQGSDTRVTVPLLAPSLVITIADALDEAEARGRQQIENPRLVTIDYTNHEGRRSFRRIVPLKIEFGCNEWYKKSQWLLTATDFDKGVLRTFAMSKIWEWRVE